MKNTSSYCFQTLSATFFDSRRKVYRNMSKLFLPVQKIFWSYRFFRIVFFCFWNVFGVWAKRFWHFGLNYSVKLTQLLFRCSDEHFDKKKDLNFFFKIGGHFFPNFSKNIPQSWRNCFYAFRRKFWWKTIF